MTLQERQKKEIEMLQRELATLWVPDIDRLISAIEECKRDPETYFKNIDEQE